MIEEGMREHFAAMAMQAMIRSIEGRADSLDELRPVADAIAMASVLFADALLAELAKEPTP